MFSMYFSGLPRLCIEVLHNSKEEMDAAQSKSICQLVLDWIHAQWLEDQNLTLETLAGKKHLLYVGKNNTMQGLQESQPTTAQTG
jgi:YesN/AraC family two-component response regulator